MRLGIFLFTLGIFLQLPLSAQDKMAEISLSGRPFDVQPHPFRLERVINLLPMGECIGYVRLGLMRNIRVARFHNPMEQEIISFLAPGFSNLPDAPALLLTVEEIRLHELYNTYKERTVCALRLGFYTRDNNGSLQALGQIATNTETYRLETNLQTHGSNIERALESCINSFLNRWRSGDLQLIPVTEQALLMRAPIPSSIPLGRELPEGIFATYTDYIDGRITTFPRAHKIEDIKGKLSIQWEFPDDLCLPDSNRLVAGHDGFDFWGISFDSKVYTRIKDGYYRLNPSRYGPVADLPEPPDQYATAFSMFVGGVLGVLTYEGIRRINPGKLEYYISPGCGAPTTLVEEVLRQPVSRVLIYASDLNNSNQTIEVTIDDSLSFELAPDDFRLLEFDPSLAQTHICAVDNKEQCTTLDLKLFENQVLMIADRRKKAPRLDLQDRGSSTEILNKIRSRSALFQPIKD
ncbi:hypothetical protein [Phaeodactylibacter sp.]|uniref:hypothetical protein n=3 Tax=Phaeodactylibacter sp. TaxID=1940289 RepID=UPI0025E44B71|nr:hypothetical protein [Phaeodactylibacter sp.]MCI5090485.1 hypothetical protein [Phaeodactylibacter sp.]